MNFNSLKQELSTKIIHSLKSRVGQECILLDIPYYTNIGDVLIWQGTECFLSANNIKCIYRTSCDNFKYRKISKDVTILLQGGGNFGDIWRHHQVLRNNITELYPDNPIIVLPQTIYYENEEIMINDAQIMNRHKNLTICARDQFSYELLEKHFTGSTHLMLPDMAYCISDKVLNQYRIDSNPDLALYLKRNDKEFNTTNVAEEILKDETRKIEVRDWPSMEKGSLVMSIYRQLVRLNKLTCGLTRSFIDLYMYRVFRKSLIKTGVQFVSKYSAIYTTRLHVAILSSLLEKPFVFVNNSYGKNKQFYETWLSSCDQIKFK